MKSIYTMIFCLLSITDMSGQSQVLTTYTTKDGLAHNNIRDIDIDSTGFLWLSTWDGISRFDGMEFKNYFHLPGDTTTLPYFSIRQSVIDRENNLWVQAENGRLCRFDRANERFIQITGLGDVSFYYISGMTTDKSGNILLLLPTGVVRFNPARNETTFFRFGNNSEISDLKSFATRSITIEGDDILWVIYRNAFEFCLKDNPGNEYDSAQLINRYKINVPFDPEIPKVDLAWTSKIIRDSEECLWLSSNTGIFNFDSQKKEFNYYTGDLSQIKFVSDTPVSFYRPDNGLTIQFPDDTAKINLPADNCKIPIAVFATNRNVFWFSSITYEGNYTGLIKCITIPYNFGLINPYSDDPGGFCVYGISEDKKGGLWIAARDKKYITRILPDGSVERINELNSEKHIQYWHPRSLIPDEKGMWVGYFSDMLVYYDLSKNTVTKRTTASRYFHTICRDRNGIFYLGDTKIRRYDAINDTIEELVTLKGDDNIFCFYLEDDSILWAGASGSILLRLSINNLYLKEYIVCRDRYNIEDICPGSDGEYWLTLLGGGVCRFNHETGKSTFYTTANGLSNNTTYSLLKDSQGNIWISTNEGISVINPSTSVIRTFGLNEGLAIHEFNSDAAYESRDGHFYFGGVGGIVKFDPKETLGASVSFGKNKICVDDLKISGENKRTGKPAYELDTIILNKGENNFHISFSSLDFINPEKIKYRYHLADNFDEKWVYTTAKDRNINYANLKPGWYSLVIQSLDNNGLWVGEKKIVIWAKPFFYQTKTFKIALPLLAVMIIVSFVNLRIRNIKQRETQIQNTLRLHALRGQMNPHFIFNSLNSINYFISDNDQLSANNYIADFSRLIRATLYNFDKDFIAFENELNTINDYLKMEHLRVGDKFTYEIQVNEEINGACLEVVPGLIQPFIENAIWHGIMGLEKRKGNLKIRFLRPETDRMRCIIEDDGVGRKENGESSVTLTGHRSKGIENIKERLNVVGKIRGSQYDLQITDLFPDRMERGTRVIIELPVKF